MFKIIGILTLKSGWEVEISKTVNAEDEKFACRKITCLLKNEYTDEFQYVDLVAIKIHRYTK